MAEELWHALGPHIRTYKLTPSRVVPVSKRRLRLETRTGHFEAAVTSPEQEMARRVVADWAAEQGVRRITRHLRNMYNERWRTVESNSVLYLAHLWTGRNLVVNAEDMAAAGEQLANLHTALDGCESALATTEIALENRHGRWLDILGRARKKISETQFAKSDVNDREVSLLESWRQRWDALAVRVLRQLESDGYEDWAQPAKAKNSVAWNGYRLGHIVRLQDGGLAVNQPLPPVRDTPFYDLAALCVDAANEGEPRDVFEIVETYDLHRNLTAQDRCLVVSFAAFPHRALAILETLQRKKRKSIEEVEWRRVERQFATAEQLLDEVSG